MSKYAFFIWSSYGLTLAVLAWNVCVPLLRRNELKRRLSEGGPDEEDAVSGARYRTQAMGGVAAMRGESRIR
jgi:heme exporter protein CcmD